VALAACAARARDPDAPLLVVPADLHVAPVGRYRAALRSMAARAARFDGLVTLGLRPTRPATGYGYLRHGRATRRIAAGSFHPVERYVEKPPPAVARRLARDGRHAWSGGTFAFRPQVFLDALATHLPAVADPLARAFPPGRRKPSAAALARAYDAMPSISVDYGVMEKAAPQEVFVATIEWDDLGSWDAVGRQRRPDADGNRLRGEVTAVDSSDCVVDADGGHVALLGVKDLIVVRTADAVLVARRGRGEDVRQVVDRLRARGRGDLVE
jgi:mannose-1-phosphate guanylyltransferase